MVVEVIIHDNIANSCKTLSLRQPVFMIGRGQECQVRLDSRFVSAQHVRVTAVDGGFEVEVMESEAYNGAGHDMLVGAIAKASAAANVGYCEVMPQRIYVAPLNIDHANTTVTLQLKDRPETRFVLSDLRPPPGRTRS